MPSAAGLARRLRRQAQLLTGRHPTQLPSRDERARLVARAANAGLNHQCPVCGARLRAFVPFGVPRRPRAKCPVCGSLEWHRLGWTQAEKVLAGRRGPTRVMQVAPEPEIARRFRETPGVAYTSVDLAFGRAAIVCSIEQLPFRSGAFDIVYCSHVLEHVTDDLAAMRELCRVTADDGTAVLLVPITADETWGDPSITDPDERTRLFGQDDHVRVFGPDFTDRLAESGWTVEVVTVEDFAPAEAARLGLPEGPISRPAGDVFLCRPQR